MYAFLGRREWVFCTRTMHDRPYMLNTLYPALTGTLRVMEPIKFKMPWTYDKGCLYAVFLQYMIEHPSFRGWCSRANMALHALNELIRMFREIPLCGFVQNRSNPSPEFPRQSRVQSTEPCNITNDSQNVIPGMEAGETDTQNATREKTVLIHRRRMHLAIRIKGYKLL